MSNGAQRLARVLFWGLATLLAASDVFGVERDAIESVARQVFSQVDEIGPLAGKPPAAAVYHHRLHTPW